MRILVTGAAGFIGFSLSSYLLKKNHKVFGIDNFDKYYSLSLKKKRLKILNKSNNFIFNQIDINNKKKLKYFFRGKRIDIIINLAAQAGVRHSFEKPIKYINVNILGFLNLIEAAKDNKIKKFIYASSSSVYGENNNFPLKENENLNPKNIYAVSKKLNEKIAEMQQKTGSTSFVGLRFFTVYGEWGRPDMFMMKLFKSHMTNKTFYLNNYGNHLRDFTYIGDAVEAVSKLIKKRFKKHEIFNICSDNPVNIYDVVKDFNKRYPVKVKLTKIHKADILKTHGSNKKLNRNISKIKYSNFFETFYKTFEWYKKNKIYKL
jgi:UDP-glucuronate 4-epimerase